MMKAARITNIISDEGGTQMEIVKSILTQNRCYQGGKKITVRGLMLHSVGCPQPNAAVFVKNWNNAKAAVCVHAFIDGNTGAIHQTLPWDHRAWHCGSGAKGSANNTHIGVEMCEPSCIKYTSGASFTCSNRDAALAVVKRTYDAAVELFAYLCELYKLDPEAGGVIISHKEGHDRGVASGHGDPDHLWNGLQSGYTMAGFRQDVKKAMERRKAAAAGQPAAAPQPKPQSQPAAPQNAGAVSPGVAKAAAPGEMSVSDRGVELIAKFEGCRLEAYKCAAGVWTIGYGHTAGVNQGDTLPSEEAARALLKKDLQLYGGYVNSFVKNGTITFPLNQNQFDALTSFCYNCGRGNLQKLVTNRDAATVAEKILLYNKGGGKVLEGLVRRRKEERALFIS